MTEINSRRIAKNYFYLLTLIFLIAQILILTDIEITGSDDILGGVILSSLFLIFIGLTIKGYNWAKWVLTVLLILFGTLFLFAGFEVPSLNFKIVGLYYFFFGLIPHFSGRLKSITILKPKSATEELTDSNKVTSLKNLTLPYLLNRYKSMLIDGLLFIVFLTVCLLINAELEFSSMWIFVLYTIIVLSYEPILTAYSHTFGQKVMGIRVRSINDTDKRINLNQAYIRFFTKILLGWLSFITIIFNKEKRAIHDFAASSVVIEL